VPEPDGAYGCAKGFDGELLDAAPPDLVVAQRRWQRAGGCTRDSTIPQLGESHAVFAGDRARPAPAREKIPSKA
jgi:hypothetical protein